ncbi:glycosyltransferase [Synechococcus sp. CBW1002]|uniref:glycosyltransferase family protein n=1 Tax=Synechococcus sp. CBW1002 TaxID=1353134 RepID=UPI00351C7780
MFLLSLIQQGCPIRIYGVRWEKSPFWTQLQSFHAGNQLIGANYVKAIKSAQACLGLLSHQNRDLITTRSLEIPACAGVFCAELSSEHQLLYENNIEALIWSDSESCALSVRGLLLDGHRRASIQKAGTSHVRAMGVGNEDICRHILSVVGQ